MTSTASAARHTRQARLSEVGERGQALLAGAHVQLRGSGFVARVEESYLHRAGVGEVGRGLAPAESSRHAIVELPPWLTSLDPSARDVAAGAFYALVTIRSILSVAPSP